ncbi:CocE/NonD family hydrolase [Halovivax cerinus]|uniref:CocE/NonD family hydrolase n=1 Tax=Halovivax cerinus TaxID=1487865 RepID=A0ABD5NTN0_9EURY|nr:CocE/NonD family hydrolase [Halovivax cerinus]
MVATNSRDGGGFTRHYGVSIPVGDERVRATRYEPDDGDSPRPALLFYYPYRTDDHLAYGAYAPIIEYVATHGYEVITADMVGTGGSTGQKLETSDVADEGAEAEAVIDWIADQPWCNGRVGMFGKSYGGNNCLAAAAREPEPLEAIVPIMAGISSYEEVAYLGGTLNPFERGGHWNSQMLALQSLPTSFRDADGQWEEAWHDHLAQLRDGGPWLFNTLSHPQKDEYWERRELPVEDVSVPTFAVSGWRDYFPSPTIEFGNRIEAPTTVLLGPWRHAMPHRARETTIDFRPRVVAWFDHYLKDVDNEVPEWPTFSFWTERDGGGVVEGGTWRETDSWPPSGETLSYALTPDGLTPESSYQSGPLDVEYEHDYTVGMYSPDDRPFSVPVDVGPDDARSLCFETDPVDDPIELTGSPTVTLRLRSTVDDPLVVGRLVDVAPDGTARLVSHGRLRTSHRNGHADPEPVEPGTEYTVTLDMKPKSHVFEPGHRLRLAISAAFFPLALPTTTEPGRYTVLSSPDDPAVVSFPGTTHDADPTFEDRIEMGDPDESTVPASSPYATRKEGGWSTTRDHLTDVATVEAGMAHAMTVPHGGSMSFDQSIEASAAPTDPTEFVVRATTEAAVEHETTRVESRVECRISPTRTDYSVRTTMDGQSVFEECWSRSNELGR